MTPKRFLIILAILFVIFIVGITLYIRETIANELPSIEQLENPKQNYATQVMSADGELLDHFYIERRISLQYDSIPKDFINALIAVEDRKFMEHWGVHTFRIAKAFVKNILAMRTKEGASTITMQLARNLYFTPENSLKRKIREAFTAIQIEKTFTKKEILEMYSNTVAFGRGAYGIQIASQVYFDKSPYELTLAECAYLVGLLKAPEHYNGMIDYEKAISRRNLVLDLMREQNYIGEAQYIQSLQEPINLAKGIDRKNKRGELAPHFVEMIRQKLSKGANLNGYDLYRDGLIIYTTLNSRIQRFANEAVEEHLSKYQTIFNKSWSWNNKKELLNELVLRAIKNRSDYIAAPEIKKNEITSFLKSSKQFVDSVKNAATTIQVGLVVLDPTSGEILGMVGASPKFMREHPDSKYSLNHAVQIKRQPGSSFKPFVYASALLAGATPQTSIECGPFTYKNPETGEVWSPRGFGNCDDGQLTTLSQALAGSINSVSARLITQITSPGAVISLAHRMGIESNLKAVPALSLGAGGEVTPLEIISAFCTFANQGIYIPYRSVNRIEDQFGNILQQENKTLQASDIMSKKVANQLTGMLEGVVNFGTGSKVRDYFRNCDAAGKTGTTNDFTDAWFIGYTPQLVAGVWVGFDDPRITFPEGYGYAAQAAAPLWGILMNKIYSDEKLPYKQREFILQSNTDSTNLQTTQTIAPANVQVATANNKAQQAEQTSSKKDDDSKENLAKQKHQFPALPKKTQDATKPKKEFVY